MFFDTSSFLVPNDYTRFMFSFNCALTKKNYEMRVWFLLVRLRFGGFERKETGVRSSPFFSFVALLGRPFSIASGAERAGKKKEIARPFSIVHK